MTVQSVTPNRLGTVTRPNPYVGREVRGTLDLAASLEGMCSDDSQVFTTRAGNLALALMYRHALRPCLGPEGLMIARELTARVRGSRFGSVALDVSFMQPRVVQQVRSPFLHAVRLPFAGRDLVAGLIDEQQIVHQSLPPRAVADWPGYPEMRVAETTSPDIAFAIAGALQPLVDAGAILEVPDVFFAKNQAAAAGQPLQD